MKRERISNYMGKLGGDSFSRLYIAAVTDCIFLADKDGVTDLYCTEDEYETISKWMLGNGAWNWDKKTIWGMTLKII